MVQGDSTPGFPPLLIGIICAIILVLLSLCTFFTCRSVRSISPERSEHHSRSSNGERRSQAGRRGGPPSDDIHGDIIARGSTRSRNEPGTLRLETWRNTVRTPSDVYSRS